MKERVEDILKVLNLEVIRDTVSYEDLDRVKNKLKEISKAPISPEHENLVKFAKLISENVLDQKTLDLSQDALSSIFRSLQDLQIDYKNLLKRFKLEVDHNNELQDQFRKVKDQVATMGDPSKPLNSWPDIVHMLCELNQDLNDQCDGSYIIEQEEYESFLKMEGAFDQLKTCYNHLLKVLGK